MTETKQWNRFAHRRHTHADIVSCEVAGEAGHPPRWWYLTYPVVREAIERMIDLIEEDPDDRPDAEQELRQLKEALVELPSDESWLST